MTKQIVADCSVCGAWYVRDERSNAAEKLLDRVLREEVSLIVPDLWWHENLNLLRTCVMRERMSLQEARKAFYFLEEIPLETVHAQRIGHARIFELAVQHQLSAYDATYLSLAEARGLTLVTADQHLLTLRLQHDWIEQLR